MEGGWFGFHPFNGRTSPWPSCREVEGGGCFAIADSRIVAVVSVPASPWDGSPSMAADAAWGFVLASHGSMVWHQCCQHIQVKEGGWFAIVSLFHSFRCFTCFSCFTCFNCFTCFSCFGETATPRHGHRVERWKAVDGSPSLTAVLWPCVPSRHPHGMVARQLWRMVPGASCVPSMARWCGIDAASIFR